MERKTFLRIATAAIITPFSGHLIPANMEPRQFLFKDDGRIPNSRYPLLLYRNVFQQRGASGATWLEQQFEMQGWSNSWRNGIYPFHHYHSTSHEVLGIYSGTALLHLGGESGEKIQIKAGDILIIPAGVGHKNLGSDDLGVVGAYPEGRSWDINKGEPGERPQADKNIAAVPLPKTDPLCGKKGLPDIWTA